MKRAMSENINGIDIKFNVHNSTKFIIDCSWKTSNEFTKLLYAFSFIDEIINQELFPSIKTKVFQEDPF